MKGLLLAFAMLAVALLPASPNSRGLHLEEELKRPEAQKAVADYLLQHCQFTVDPARGPTTEPTTESDYSPPQRVNISCWQDAPPEAQ